ncbi:pyrokinin-1 receptor [Cardiocondyla obscurior]|uniref:pyrokinin-1 receptor n=1 Tax=Cardiocondyla obscurior TaxID=286306 RepID=UPI0039657788
MSNEYSVTTSYVEVPFPRIKMEPVTTTHPTKINIVVPVIPEPARNIMDLVLLTAGVSLNASLGLFIVLNSTMYNSTNCYVVSLVLSNFVILFEPLMRICEWIFGIHLKINLDYVFIMSFGTSILTIILLNVETYIVICQKNSPLRKSFLKASSAIKGIIFIWTAIVMAASIELHLYDHFEKEIVDDIYVSSTVMFLIFPLLVFIILNYFILYNLTMSKSTSGTWPGKDVKRFVFLIGVHMGFFLTVVPYRVTRAISLISRRNDTMIEITYTMVKTYPIILPIISFLTSIKVPSSAR